ncbi:uncharacterized protein AKAW2_50164S [Aspergillus luchuensis]|uniref:Uncharacterized protein n=1 Tax=Aspergillus kawachii TaxID=1069201 RepID=A0A7R7WBB5_ASPKA|nr:uncharacterized protein AKAW2_50164S [Aspergillus luchuensis]BCR99822.1 hypothetical protein AKAW2_50164S [Aspergillus luchuensis]
MLWDDLSGHLVVVDLEDVKWLKRPWALDCISDSTQRTRCVGAMKYKPGFKKVEYTVNSMAVSQARDNLFGNVAKHAATRRRGLYLRPSSEYAFCNTNRTCCKNPSARQA